MPNLSQRGITMPESPIRKLVPFAESAKANGKKVYHLNIGQPDIKTPENALHAVRTTNHDVIAYSHSAGNESYRKGLAKYYNRIGINVDYTDILVTTGGSEAILFAFLSALNAGDEVIIPEPFYTNYNGFAISAGITVKPVTSSIDKSFALPPIDDIEELITPETKGIVICNPNNPTGYLYSKQELNKLRNIVKKHNLFLFADEVYREFCYDGLEHISVLQLEGIEDNTILFDSVSKRYSACGVRTGALVSRNKEFIATALKFAQARLSPPSFGQMLGEAALDTPVEYFDNVYNEYVDRRNYVIEALNKIEGVYAPKPKGAFYTIVHLPVDDSERFCQWLLEAFDYKGETVMLAPASGFYATQGLGKQEVRLAYVLKKDDLKKAVKCIEEGLNAYPGRIDK